MLSPNFVQNSSHRVTVGVPSVQALLISSWHLKERLLIICKDEDAAFSFAADLETLSKGAMDRPINVEVFPGWEQSLFSPIAPSLRTRFARTGVLAAVHTNNVETSVIVTTLQALCQRTIPPALFNEYSVELAAGQEFESREPIIKRLLDAGYLRVDTVDDVGTFAVRGEIIDVFPPGRDNPLRVELFGDVVERIREFDPIDQRTSKSTEVISSVRIMPAREVLINSFTYPSLRERLKSSADNRGIPRSVRDPILAQLHEGIYPDHSDSWAPFAYPEQSTFLDHLSSSFNLVWCDQDGCLGSMKAFYEEQKRLNQEAESSLFVCPTAEELYLPVSTIEEKLRSTPKVFFDRIEFFNEEEREKIVVNTNIFSSKEPARRLSDLSIQIKDWIAKEVKILVLASTRAQAERIKFLLGERGIPTSVGGNLRLGTVKIEIGSASAGFYWAEEKIVILLEQDVLGEKRERRSPKRSTERKHAAKDWAGLSALSDLAVGDKIVHVDHGIGRYQGLTRLHLLGAASDFLTVEYADKDKLYLPVYRLNAIQKYAGGNPSTGLDKLGSQHFSKTKQKVKDAVRKLAVDLVQLYAERSIRPGIRFSPPDSYFREFEAKFPFDETADQVKAIDDSLSDLESGKVMDRLVCGDVGYGKTEVAIRAAFFAVNQGKQVAVLVPTTVLAQQHEESFRNRMKDYPVVVESLSRFKSVRQQKDILHRLAEGKVDIIIGTHRLLSMDVKFSDLALLVIDEEHRFGVEHKEKLKALRVNTHVLTLTATPIPRTLHMALSGLRDISLINTPPIDRLPIRTYVSRYDESLIKRALEQELSRGGQVFFLHNRTQSINKVAERLEELVPQAKVLVAHGQMQERQLEKAMLAFYHKQANVLVCTSIIESGLDLPSANTIIIDRADTFGLAQLYQIRGRVGRGQARAYAYLFIPAEGSITEDSKRRIEVIQRYVELGSGFNIASHDLEIRGGGDLLGPQQSGHIGAVGFELYTELLEEAVKELKGKPPEEGAQERKEPEIKVPYSAYLSEDYVPDVHQRLALYRRFSAAIDEDQLSALEEELRDRFGEMPHEAINLGWLIRIKQVLKKIGITTLNAGNEKISLLTGEQTILDPIRAITLVSAYPDRYQITPDSKFVAKARNESMQDLYFAIEKLLRDLQ